MKLTEPYATHVFGIIYFAYGISYVKLTEPYGTHVFGSVTSNLS